MDIGKALTFYTEDERWIEKIAIGTGVLLLSSILSIVLVGLLGFFIVMGYCVRLMNNVKNDVTPVLPEWDQWGDDLVRGLKLFVVQFVWSLPMILISVPIVIGSALTDSGQSGEFFGVTLLLCGSCLAVLYGIFYMVIQPGITVAFAENEQISDGLQLGRVWNWTMDRLGQVVIVALVVLVAGTILQTIGAIVGLILCIVGLIVTLPLAYLITYFLTYHLYGQLARVGVASSDTADTSGDDEDWVPPSSIIEE